MGTPSNHRRDYDVLIAGGGPAGLAAAIAMAERQAKVVVVDPKSVPSHLTRCELLPIAALPILERLSIDSILAGSVRLKGQINLWNGDTIEDHGTDLGPELSGWSIERNLIDHKLRQRINDFGVDIFPMKAKDIRGTAGHWQVRLKAENIEETIHCRYLIDATGRSASLARRLRARLSFGPKIVAITFNVSAQVQAEFDPKLLVEAQPNGWWYALPRQGGGGTIAFLTSAVEASMATRHPWEFIKTNSTTLKLITPPNSDNDSILVSLCDSRRARLSPITGIGWLATGDAATAFDPISSQGMFNALSAGFFAGNAVADTLNGDQHAANIYAELVSRAAARSHRETSYQYSAANYQQVPFWADHSSCY